MSVSGGGRRDQGLDDDPPRRGPRGPRGPRTGWPVHCVQSDEADDDDGFSFQGSIRRMTLHNFMQYSSVSFSPGPHLNVILGPNGSGKSSIVNAICLGLNGKPQSLGRATHLAEFIRTGQPEATIEIELHNPDVSAGHWVVNRCWKKDGKSVWRLNGRTVKQAEIDALIKELQIQTGNLCQFLPQDKVHEFSKMNSKELLEKTIDAVGEVELRADHLKLKKMQTDLAENERIQENRVRTLEETQRTLVSLEHEVKNFEEKRAKENKMLLLEKRKAWLYHEEQRKVAKEAQQRLANAKKDFENQMREIEPIRTQVGDWSRKRATVAAKVRDAVVKLRGTVSQAKKATEKIEQIEDDISTKEDEIEQLRERSEKKKLEVKNYEEELSSMKAEIAEVDDDPTLEPNIRNMEADMKTIQAKVETFNSEKFQCNEDIAIMDSNVSQIRRELVEIENIEHQKLQILKRQENGDDTYRAILWLRENGQIFARKIHEPILVNIDVKDKKDAIYLENCIGMRDLMAFVAEDPDDMNLFLNELRNKKGLRISAVHARADDTPENYRNDQRFESEELLNLGFKSSVKDLFSAPNPVKAYLCRMKNLHQIGVFDKRAEAHVTTIVNQMQMRIFFAGETKYTSIVSRYSKQTSTSSFNIVPKGLLEFAADSDKIYQLRSELQKKEAEKGPFIDHLQQLDVKTRNEQKKLESLKINLKELKQKKHYKNILKAKLSAKETELRRFLASDCDSKMEIRAIEKRKAQMAQTTVKLANELKNAIMGHKVHSIQLEIMKTSEQNLVDVAERKKAEVKAREEGLSGISYELKIEEQNYAEANEELNSRLFLAQKATGNGFKGDRIPRLVIDEFKANTAWLPSTVEEVQIMVDELQGQIACLEDVNPDVIKRYSDLKETESELDRDIARYEQRRQAATVDAQVTRDRWLGKLTEMVQNISTRFSNYFASMGFSGEVTLNQGNHQNDYANFGIDIWVKYRANLELQKLTPHLQSGGERSVATALYMLALQELTVVPFRCVDEINQGMDAVNERRVFDLLVRTSCKETSAQYFLLTPKLLANLSYDKNMTVLVVNNGDGMCHHEQWNVEQFIEMACRE